MNASRRPPADARRRAFSSASGPAANAHRLGPAAFLVHGAWAWLLPALAAIALYARTLGAAFVWDDWDLIARNAALQGPDWARALTQDFWQPTGGGTGMWRPLVTLSYRIDGLWTGWQPWGFHAVNVGLHALSCALLARLALRRGLPAWAACAAGLVYATAPALTEPVAWIAGRTDGFVVLGSLLALLAAARWRTTRTRRELAVLVVGVALALLAKETALVLPLLLAADSLDERCEGDGRAASSAAAARRGWSTMLPALASLGVVAIWWLAHRAFVPPSAHAAEPGAAAGMAALVWAHLEWLSPWAAHSPLLALWQPPATATAVAAWLGLAAVLGASALAWRARRPVLLLVALVFAPLLPVAAATLVETGTRFAERALALPVAGLALALATLAAGAPGRARWPAKVLLLGWVLWQTVVTVPLVDVWRDDEARIRRVVHVRPTDPDALLGLADLLSSLGRPDEAANLIARAEVLSPGGHDALLARASAEFRAGRLPQALIAAEQALARDRGSLAAGVIRVRTLARLARTAEAVADGEALCANFPAEPAATGALGAARFASGDAAGAKPLLADASAHLLDDSGLAWDLGRAAIATGDIATARAAFERAVRAAPEFYEAWLGVADTRARLGDGPGAQAALVRAQALPGAADGRAAALRARIGSP